MDIAPDSLEASQARTRRTENLHHIRFPTFKHEHPPVKNVNDMAKEQLTLGQRVADAVANGMGSWRFIIVQSTILLLWIILNSMNWWPWKWDVYPFIAMNLLLSCQAAYAAPVIMMSQNRQAEKDRLTAQNDYITDCKGEEEIRHIMQHLDHQDELILNILNHMVEQRRELMERLSRLDPLLAEKLGGEVHQIAIEEQEK